MSPPLLFCNAIMAPQRSHRGRDAGIHFWKHAIGVHAMNVRFGRANALRACQRFLFLELHSRSKAPTAAVASCYGKARK